MDNYQVQNWSTERAAKIGYYYPMGKASITKLLRDGVEYSVKDTSGETVLRTAPPELVLRSVIRSLTQTRSLRSISEDSGVPYTTLRRFAVDGKTIKHGAMLQLAGVQAVREELERARASLTGGIAADTEEAALRLQQIFAPAELEQIVYSLERWAFSVGPRNVPDHLRSAIGFLKSFREQSNAWLEDELRSQYGGPDDETFISASDEVSAADRKRVESQFAELEGSDDPAADLDDL